MLCKYREDPQKVHLKSLISSFYKYFLFSGKQWIKGRNRRQCTGSRSHHRRRFHQSWLLGFFPQGRIGLSAAGFSVFFGTSSGDAEDADSWLRRHCAFGVLLLLLGPFLETERLLVDRMKPEILKNIIRFNFVV